MRIAVNTRFLIKNQLEGIGWYTYETFKRIAINHPEHEFFFIFDRPYDPQFIFSHNVTPIVVGPPARHPFLFIWWFELSIPRVLKKIKADAFISPDAYGSLNTKVPTLLVIHDLNFEHYPEYIPRLARWHYRYFTPRFARKATRIATVSAFSKSDIVKQYGIDPDKIDVTYNGANQHFTPVSEEKKTLIKKDLTQGEDYFVFVGALNPRKNLSNLFKAFDLFKTNNPDVKTKLLIVGEKMYWTDDIKNSYLQMTHKSEVLFSGRLNLEKLVEVTGSAKALFYVSVFEGFGIPIVEAFFADVPVVTSTTTSMPEIAGEAALLVDPFNISEIAVAMEKITFDKELTQSLIKLGRERRKLFSWDKTADQLWNSFQKMTKGLNKKNSAK
ncbi:MAG: glycosyltransferase family 1 protein [Bacteroidales bacterium]|nr:glycosyltransferase family 1 protein [Bacteroidales bacterium]